jgi:sugar lactone lactonase YvrE
MRARILCLASLVAASTAAFLACQDNGDGTVPVIPGLHYNGDAASDATIGDDSGPVVVTNMDAGGDACIETTSASPDGDIAVGPATLAFDPCGVGSPDALYWDTTTQVLYIADDRNNQVWTWSDANGFQKLVALPDDPAADDAGATKLTGITVSASTLIVARYGNGAFGALFSYNLGATGGAATAIAGVDPTRYRTALAVDGTGKIYSDSWSAPVDGGDAAGGGIDLVGLTGTTTFLSGLDRPRGLIIVGTQIYVSDLAQNVIYSIPTDLSLLDAGADDADAEAGAAVDASMSPYPVYASLPAPDQLSIGPNGSVFAGEKLADGGAPQLRQIFADGGIVSFQPTVTFTSLAGVAYDATAKRLFVADSNGGSVRTIKIYPAQ